MKHIKRAVSLALVLMMIVSMFSMNILQASAGETVASSARLLGDVDGDGIVNIYDATSIQLSIAKADGYIDYSTADHDSEEFKVADVDKDGVVNIFDVTLIQLWIADSAAGQGYGIGEAMETEPPVPELKDGYYLVGTLNGVNCWSKNITADRQLTLNTGAQDVEEYYLEYTFTEGDEIKVVKLESGAVTAYYNSDGANYTITDKKAGVNTIYFRPDGNDSWSYKYLTVPDKTPSSPDEPTEEPTQQPTQEPTQAATQEPTQSAAEDGYYLGGNFSGEELWETADASRKLTLNAGAQDVEEYSIKYTFAAGDEIKVAKVENGEMTTWYKDGQDNALAITATGEFEVYFRPAGNAFPPAGGT